MVTPEAKKYLLFTAVFLLYNVIAIPEALGQSCHRESIVAGDFNNDGRPDIAIANFCRNNVSIFLWTKDGLEFVQDFDLNGSPVSILAAHFGYDGNLDLATGNTNPNTVAVLLGNGDGSFLPPIHFTIPREVLSISAADFNNDGLVDIIVRVPDALCILLGDGRGTFSPPVCFPFKT